MNSSSPDSLIPAGMCRESVGDSGDARGAVSGVAFGGSLLFHLGIASLVFFNLPNSESPELPPAKASMVVSMVSSNPQIKRPPPPANIDFEVETPVAETALDPQPEEAEPTAETSAAAQPVGIDQAPAASVVAPAAELPADQAIGNSGTPGISTTAINNSVTAYISTYKRSLTSGWLSACLRYQNEHGVKTCPPGEDGKSETTNAVNASTSRLFSTYVGGAGANIRASKDLLAEMDSIRPFLNENSIIGDLARQRYQLAEANYCRLNSCRSFALSTYGSFPSFDTPVSNEGFITIAGFGNESGGPGFLSGLMSLMPKPKPASSAAPFIPYRFTGARTEQAESENEFKVKALMFPVSR